MVRDALVDASCLIGLRRIGRLELLPELFGRVYITREVVSEIEDVLPWMNVVEAANRGAVSAYLLRLDLGEASTLVAASEMEPRPVVVMDERAGRQAAKLLNLEIVGTLGLLVQAKRMGLVRSVRQEITALTESGFRVSQELIAVALELAGEPPQQSR